MSEQNAIPKVQDSNVMYVSNILLLFYVAPRRSFKEHVTHKMAFLDTLLSHVTLCHFFWNPLPPFVIC